MPAGTPMSLSLPTPATRQFMNFELSEQAPPVTDVRQGVPVTAETLRSERKPRRLSHEAQKLATTQEVRLELAHLRDILLNLRTEVTNFTKEIDRTATSASLQIQQL